ncbi:DUF6297 family protein [Nesterenkonia rhizosphaerae]|uniref:ABC transporter permease n=1 Tax=Nesterenkonia rhizosphaerae TaxID=1348272 RepID=A0ABP9G3G9_9MICC
MHYRRRQGAPTAGDRWFVLYLIGFVTGFFVIPVAYVIGDYLDPEFARRISSADTRPWVASLCTALGVTALWAGRVQGPAYMPPFLAQTLLSSPIDRRRILFAPTAGSVALVAAVTAACGAVGFFALTTAGLWGWERFFLMCAAALSGGAILALLAFLGQRVTVASTAALSAAAVLLAAAGFVQELFIMLHPAGWFALLWSQGPWWWLVPLALSLCVALAMLALHPAALGELPEQRVIGQSSRLADARLFTSTGNVHDAVQLFRQPPRRHRPGAAVHSGVPGLSGLRQEIHVAIRSPASLIAAAVCIPVGAAALSVAATAVGYGFDESRLILTVPAGLAGALLVFFGTGSLTEGWRTLKNEFDAASLYGWSARDALGRRLLWPLLGTGLLSGIGVVLAGAFHRELLSGALWVAAVSLLALTARFFQTMRNRDIPVEFLAPTVIPGGVDLSAVKILAWLGDGIIITVAGTLALIVLPWKLPSLALTMLVIVMGTALWGWIRTGQRFFAASPLRHWQHRQTAPPESSY